MNTLSIKINQQQDGPACIQQNQLPQNDLHSNLISRNACYSLYYISTYPVSKVQLKLTSELFQIFVRKLLLDF